MGASVRFVYRMIQESDADAVINFYEVVTGLTYLLLRPKIPMICIAHQYYFLHPQAPLPPRASRMQLAALKFFTRLTSAGATKRLALSLRPLEPCPERRLTVVPPLLRPEVRQLRPTPGQYIHGYMVNAGLPPTCAAGMPAARKYRFVSSGTVPAACGRKTLPSPSTALTTELFCASWPDAGPTPPQPASSRLPKPCIWENPY